MKAKIQRWGNSLALRIPRPFANQAKIREGTNVDISLIDERIVITSISEEEYSLDNFLEKITNKNIHDEISFGEPVGRELW